MTQDTMHVRPRKGLLILDPASGKPLPAVGARVPNTSYWRRRLRASDVVATKKPRRAAPKRNDDTDNEAS